jgi:hypothetical protein
MIALMRRDHVEEEVDRRIDEAVAREMRRWQQTEEERRRERLRAFFVEELARVSGDAARTAGVRQAAREAGVEIDGPLCPSPDDGEFLLGRSRALEFRAASVGGDEVIGAHLELLGQQLA